MNNELSEILLMDLKEDAGIFLSVSDTNLEFNKKEGELLNISPRVPIEIPFNRIESYRKDARRILNKESTHLNKEGIKRLLAALLIEILGNANFGEQN